MFEPVHAPQRSEEREELGRLQIDRTAVLSALAVEMHENLECRVPGRWERFSEFLRQLETQRGGRFSPAEIAGVVCSYRGELGPTALHYVCLEGGALSFIPRLVQLGADPNQFGPIEFSPYPPQHYAPLHCAAATADLDRFRALLAVGADIHLKNSRHSDPVEIAAGRNFTRIVECAVVEGRWLDKPLYSHVVAAGKVIAVPCFQAASEKRWADVRELFESAARMVAAYPQFRAEILNLSYREATGERFPPVLHQLIGFDAPLDIVREWVDLQPNLQQEAYLTPNFGAGAPTAKPLQFAIRKERFDIANLLVDRGVSLLDYDSSGNPQGILPAVFSHGTGELRARAVAEARALGALHIISKEILPGLIGDGKWREVLAFIEQGVPAPSLSESRKDSLVSHLRMELFDSVSTQHWRKTEAVLDGLPQYEKLYGGPLAPLLLWNEGPEQHRGRGLAISDLARFGAPVRLLERAMSFAPATAARAGRGAFHWDDSSPHPISAVLTQADPARLEVVLRGEFDLSTMTPQDGNANPVLACVQGDAHRQKLLPAVLEYIERRAATHPRNAATILLGALSGASTDETITRIVESMRKVRSTIPKGEDDRVLELRPEHEKLTPAEIKRLVLGKIEPSNERWRFFQKHFSLSDAIAYTEAFDDLRNPVKTPPGVPGPFLRLLPTIHSNLKDFTMLILAAGSSRRRESELFALLGNDEFDTRRHVDYQPIPVMNLYRAIGDSTERGNPSPEAATIFRNIGALSFAFQRWNFDTKSIKDPDGSRIVPCLIEQYGLRRVPGVHTEQLGLGYELPPELKQFSTWITSGIGKRELRPFDPKFHVVLRRAYLLAGHPDYGRIVIPNPVLSSGREILPRGAYWSAEFAPGDLGERDFARARDGTLALARHFERLTLNQATLYDRYGREVSDTELKFEHQAAGILVDALRAWSEEYQGWKFDTRFETTWDKQKRLIGGPKSRGFRTLVEQMEYTQLAIETKAIPFTRMELIISPPDRPTYLQIPFPGLDGRPQFSLRVTDDVMAEMKRGSLSGMEMEGVYALFSTALKASADLTVLLRR